MILSILSIITNLSLVKALSSSNGGRQILTIGATGGTGVRALRGLLDVGYNPSNIRILTRSPGKPLVKSLAKLGFIIYEGDLDWSDDNDDDHMTNTKKQNIQKALEGCSGCYIHSLSSDTKQLDRGEVSRAINLCSVIENTSPTLSKIQMVYNSAVGEASHGVERIQQKHDVETVFFEANANIKLTSLRANLFMEELWKGYTRPSILDKGVFPFGTQCDKNIYLTSVRDMGRIAGWILNKNDDRYSKRIINIAGDMLTAPEIADEFARAQHSNCVHKDSKILRLVSRLFFRDLYQIIRFYRNTTESTDMKTIKEDFGDDLLTDFNTFLKETDWGNRALSFDDLSNVENILEIKSGI